MQPSSPDNPSSFSGTSPTNKVITNEFQYDTNPFTMFTGPTIPIKKSANKKTNESDIQAARREIYCKLRDDWDWPIVSTQPLASNIPESHNDWRERDSDSSYSPPSLRSDSEPDPYKFDTPDSVAQPVQTRKRKRQQMLREEMKWNEGLRIYIERRDAWSGARMAPDPRPTSPPTLSSPTTDNTTPTFPPTPDSLPHTTSSSSSTPPPPFPTPTTTLIPLAPPLLSPTHPTRASILPPAYATLYSKVVLQGITPNIPINLSSIVGALVQGWKKDGEWPPKGEAAVGLGLGLGLGLGGAGNRNGGKEIDRGELGRRKVRRSVGRVRRALGLGVGIDDAGRGEGRVE